MVQFRDTPDLSLDAGEALAKYRLARHNSSGDAVYADAGEKPLGSVHAAVASGSPVTIHLLGKEGTLILMASGAVSQFADVYTAADGKVSATNSGFKVGMALTSASADGDLIEVLPDPGFVAFANAAASSAVGASSTDENDFDVTHFVPAQVIKAGTCIRVRASGLCIGAVTTPQLDIRLYAGTEIIATATVAAAATNDQWLIAADIIIRTIGASGTLYATAMDSNDAAGTAIDINLKAQATEDTTAGLTIKASAQFDASNAGNTARLDALVVEVL